MKFISPNNSDYWLPKAKLTLKTESGAYFIDRNPKTFAAILSYLRTRKIFPTCEGISVEEVANEALYFGLDELAAEFGGQDQGQFKEVIIVVPNNIYNRFPPDADKNYEEHILEFFALKLDKKKRYQLSAVPEICNGKEGKNFLY